jgi:hypothetical protein
MYYIDNDDDRKRSKISEDPDKHIMASDVGWPAGMAVNIDTTNNKIENFRELEEYKKTIPPDKKIWFYYGDGSRLALDRDKYVRYYALNKDVIMETNPRYRQNVMIKKAFDDNGRQTMISNHFDGRLENDWFPEDIFLFEVYKEDPGIHKTLVPVNEKFRDKDGENFDRFRNSILNKPPEPSFGGKRRRKSRKSRKSRKTRKTRKSRKY